MDMWNWLMDCYQEKSLTIEEMETILTDDYKAERLWDDHLDSLWSRERIEMVRDEIKPVLKYLKEKESKKES